MGAHSLEEVTGQPLYAAYLVRMWQDSSDTPWRASAQSVKSGEVIRFGSLQDLFVFLGAHTGLEDYEFLLSTDS